MSFRPGLLRHHGVDGFRRLVAGWRGIEDEQDLAAGLECAGWSSVTDRLSSRYRLLRPLGQGSQGVIYLVEDQVLRRQLALKTLSRNGCDAVSISRFLHEAQVTAQLEHPGIVPIHDTGLLPGGIPYYTMRLVEGSCLAEHLIGRWGLGRHRSALIGIIREVCAAMDFAHRRGAIHRDLKPRNIMVCRWGGALVMDWGLAKLQVRDGGGAGSSAGDSPPCLAPTVPASPVSSLRRDGRMTDSIHRTMDGAALGTPAYMSPEQATGGGEMVDHRCDIYSLGVILYEALSGRSPYQRGDLQRTLEQVAQGRWTPLDGIRLGCPLPQGLVSVVHRALALRPEARFPDAGALGDALAPYCHDPGNEDAASWHPCRPRTQRRMLPMRLLASLGRGLARWGEGAVNCGSETLGVHGRRRHPGPQGPGQDGEKRHDDQGPGEGRQD